MPATIHFWKNVLYEYILRKKDFNIKKKTIFKHDYILDVDFLVKNKIKLGIRHMKMSPLIFLWAGNFPPLLLPREKKHSRK